MVTIEKILCADPEGVISFVGGGGKTSLMFHLARLLVLSGRKVLTTTTTKIFVPTPEQSTTVLVDGDPQMALHSLLYHSKYTPHITVAMSHLADSGKLKGFAPDAVNFFHKSGLFDWILVEADGAAGRALKAPGEHEPVIPSSTTALITVTGLDIIGKPLSEDTVFRSILAGKLMNLAEGEIVTESAIVDFFSQVPDPFKGITSDSRRFIFLNKADNPNLIAAGGRIAEQLRQAGVLAEAVIVGQALEQIILHSLHKLTPAS